MPAMSGSEILIFDRAAVRRHRARAAALGSAEFLFELAAERLADRLDDIKRRFSRALVLNARNGAMTAALAIRGVDLVVEAEDAAPFLGGGPRPLGVAAEAEALPFQAESFDLVLAP